jgi:formylmethanofuran dehydrogenase subunit C
MKLEKFINDAYQGRTRKKKLETHRKDIIFSLEDLADHIGTKPSRAEVEEFIPSDEILLNQLIMQKPSIKHQILWGYLTSIAAERKSEPLSLPPINYAGLELTRGTIHLEDAKDHVGERMKGGRIFIQNAAGDYLGQEMVGGGIIASGCKDYAFRKMQGGFGVLHGDARNFLALGNSGGKIVVRGNCGERAGWLMRAGRVYIQKNAGDYLGLLMSGGKIIVRGNTGKRAGWRWKGGTINAGTYGPEAENGVLGLD